MNRGARNKVEHIIQLVSGANFDAGELHRHVKRVEVCKRLLVHSNEGALAVESFLKKIIRTGSGSSVSRAAFQKKRCFLGFTETGDDGFVAGRVYQPTGFSERCRATCSCSARAGYTEESIEESKELDEKGREVQ